VYIHTIMVLSHTQELGKFTLFEGKFTA
jgi:hypothetical protein